MGRPLYKRIQEELEKEIISRKIAPNAPFLTENEAIDRAELECEQDASQRERRRELAAIRRSELDEEYIIRFAARIREIFPYCPRGRENRIAEYACRKYSGRVGRSAAAKEFDEQAVRLAVTAHIRHTETKYDTLLLKMYDRFDAREIVYDDVRKVLHLWEYGS